ncbi:PREDICTED: probable G-protein coupled receptor No18 [Branchiostoma belcheri]|uniref:Probable G-protein coupled receptor No18 n=1 Tax=Branchiostoma belcheri TaxID=7741 RepID=A0A6P4ZQ85_BRABE|nr:PREDICTED: probable G-protein coupled receptor No18 [Branchiostoma belcheri]
MSEDVQELSDDLVRPTLFNVTLPQNRTDEGPGRTVAEVTAVSLVLCTMMVVTIVGNTLVCLSVILARKLRRPANYLIVSQAVADLLVAMAVMPLSLTNELEGKWGLGKPLCDLWISVDVICCTASIINLCMISVDRYLAISHPLSYRVHRTSRVMLMLVSVVWIISALISVPALLGWGKGNEYDGETCLINQDKGYTIYSTLGAFYIPMLVMLVLYWRIYITVQRHKHSSLRRTYVTRMSPTAAERNIANDAPTGSSGAANGRVEKAKQPEPKRISLTKEYKAARTLGAIVGAFILCWLPFFIVAVIRPFCNDTCRIPPVVDGVTLWLGYANSALNPAIYGGLNNDFRAAFRAIVCCSLKDLNQRNQGMIITRNCRTEIRRGSEESGSSPMGRWTSFKLSCITFNRSLSRSSKGSGKSNKNRVGRNVQTTRV